MKNVIKLFTLVIVVLSSLMLGSCIKENEVEVKDYAFKASLQIIDDAGKVHDVGTPIKFRINLEDIKDRGDSLEITMSVGDNKAYVYTDEKPNLKHMQNSSFKDAFRNNSLILNYVPKNGGQQTVKFTISNEKFSYTVEKIIEVGTGSAISFSTLSPLKQILYSTGSEGQFSVTNSNDEDNYYTLKFEIIEGNKNCTFLYYPANNNYASTNPIKLVSGEERRILEGKGHNSFTYIYNQHEAGNNTIKLTIKDKYGNRESRTYQLSYTPLINLTITITTSRGERDSYGGHLSISFDATTKDASGKKYDYPLDHEVKAEFDITYTSAWDHQIYTKHIELPIKAGEHTFSPILTYKNESWKFESCLLYDNAKISVKNFRITGLDAGGHFSFDNAIYYKEVLYHYKEGDSFLVEVVTEVLKELKFSVK